LPPPLISLKLEMMSFPSIVHQPTKPVFTDRKSVGTLMVAASAEPGANKKQIAIVPRIILFIYVLYHEPYPVI
jgi:hypothetical protein